MKNLFKIIILIVATGLFAQAFAAGDYIWEEKFKKAIPKAEQGSAKAQYAVGEMYEKGKGTTKDAKKAFEWFSKAAKQNNKKAAYKVGRSYLDGKGVKQNYKKAHTWFKKSAGKKYVRAEYYLGVLYENGKGVLKDYDEAMKWYKRALAGGYGSASEGIKRVARAQKASDQGRRVIAAKAAKAAKPKPAPKAKPKPAPKPKAAPVVTPKVAVKVAPKAVPKAAPKPVKKTKATKSRVMAGGWKKRSKPVEYLPSSLTQCKDKGSRIECQSADISRNIGMADISYTTKATLFGFQDNGSFQISYRNNVSKIKITDPEFAESGGKVPVTLGWQDADHKLACTFENDRAMTCTKNKLRKIKLQR